tara:strand:+ start:270 stop:488 length:219 start_codon:yes stop_codon:yes gene_type:complete
MNNVILECVFLFKTTNVSEKNNNYSKIKSKNLAIMDFWNCDVGIASFFQPKLTSLLTEFNIFSLDKLSLKLK